MLCVAKPRSFGYALKCMVSFGAHTTQMTHQGAMVLGIGATVNAVELLHHQTVRQQFETAQNRSHKLAMPVPVFPTEPTSTIGFALSLISTLEDVLSNWDGPQIGEDADREMERILRHLRNVKKEVKRSLRAGTGHHRNLENQIDVLFQQVEQMLNGAARNTSTEKLMSAVKSGDTAQIEELVRNGADIHACNDRRQTALHLAAERLDVETMEILIRLGGRQGIRRLLEAVDENGNTPLLAIDYDGSFWKVTNVVKCLAKLREAAVMDVRAYDGYAALHRAAE